jgi:hypothetical protein
MIDDEPKTFVVFSQKLEPLVDTTGITDRMAIEELLNDSLEDAFLEVYYINQDNALPLVENLNFSMSRSTQSTEEIFPQDQDVAEHIEVSEEDSGIMSNDSKHSKKKSSNVFSYESMEFAT